MRPDARLRRSIGLRPFGALLFLGLAFAPWTLAAGATNPAPVPARQALPPPVTDPNSTEICLNSRISYHGGWNAAATEQMIADVLDATARAPLTAGERQIYLATPQNVYLYDATAHSLVLHKSGDSRSDGTAAFEVGIAAASLLDAGTAMHLSQLESVALWTGTSAQLASCPRASATTYANSHWDPVEPVDIVVSFGIRNVAGLTATLVAISSDESLVNPATDGPVFLDDALEELAHDSTFAAEELSPGEVSQLLWASYGCSDHFAVGKAGLVCSSAVANYYLTRHIYAVTSEGVFRFHVRRPPGTDATTRDHRIELVTAGDARPAVRSALPDLPVAPFYLIICIAGTGDWPELEVGFAAVGAILQASTMSLQGFLTGDLSTAEQTAIQTATGIPTTDHPMALLSLGHPGPSADVEDDDGLGMGLGIGKGLGLRVVDQPAADGGARIQYRLPNDAITALTLYDPTGRCVRELVSAKQAKGPHTVVWDFREDGGVAVTSGVYFCRLTVEGSSETAHVIVLR